MGFFNFYTRKQNINVELRSEDDYGPGSADMIIKDDVPKGGELGLSAVYAAIEMISGSLSVMPVSVIKTDIDSKEDPEDVYEIFKNGVMTYPRLIKLMITDMFLYGNGYAYIHRDSRDNATELQYLMSNDVQIHYVKEKNQLFYTCSYIKNGQPIEYTDMIHLIKNSRDGIQGISVLSLAERAITICKKTEQVVADYFLGGLNISGLLHAKQPLTKPQAAAAMRSFENSFSLGKGKFVRFLPYDVDFQKLTESAKDGCLIDNRRFNISEIARYFSISPLLLLDLSDSKYANVEQTNLQFLTNCLLPYVILIEEEFNKKLIKKKSKLKINLDEGQLLRTDAKSTASYYMGLTKAGCLTLNEAREGLGYPDAPNADLLMIPFSDIYQNTIADLSNPNFKPSHKDGTGNTLPNQNSEEKPLEEKTEEEDKQ